MDLQKGGDWSLKTWYQQLKCMCSNDLQGKFDKKKINLTFSRPSKFNFRCSSIDLVPKKQSGWRIITILSHPLNESFHDLIDPSICLVKYHTFV